MYPLLHWNITSEKRRDSGQRETRMFCIAEYSEFLKFFAFLTLTELIVKFHYSRETQNTFPCYMDHKMEAQ